MTANQKINRGDRRRSPGRRRPYAGGAGALAWFGSFTI